MQATASFKASVTLEPSYELQRNVINFNFVLNRHNKKLNVQLLLKYYKDPCILII